MPMHRYMASGAKVIIVVLPSEQDVASNVALGVSLSITLCLISILQPANLASDNLIRRSPTSMTLRGCALLASSQGQTGVRLRPYPKHDVSCMCR